MRRLVLFCCLCFVVLNGWTQSSERTIPFINPPTSQDRWIVGFHNDNWFGETDSMNVRDVSLGVNASIVYDYPFGKSPLSFSWGYGFSSFNVHLDGSLRRDTLNNGFVGFQPFPENYNYRKNKISANFIEIPMELRLRTRGRNQFKLYVGGKIGYVVNIHTKVIDDNGKRKAYQIPELNRWRYGLTARIGVNRMTLYGFYSLSPFLLEGKGIELYPYTIGFSFLLI